MQCVILAGGLGTRIQAITSSLPKTLITVHGRPFADYQLSWLAGHGVDRVVYCIGHLGDQIRTYVGSGEDRKLSVSYVDEGSNLLGTGGALRLALDEEALDENFLVTWGDAFLPIDFETVWRTFLECGKPALMTVYRNAGRWDRSNVRYSDGMVLEYDKTIGDPGGSGMRYIDYGLLAMNREMIRNRIPSGVRFDLADLCSSLSRESLLAGFEVFERFYEIGSPSGLRNFEDWVSRCNNP